MSLHGFFSLTICRQRKMKFPPCNVTVSSLLDASARLGLATIVLGAMSACSSTSKPQTTVSSGVVFAADGQMEEVLRVTRPRPVSSPRRQAPLPMVVTQRVKPSTRSYEASATLPGESREEKIVRLVSAGRLKATSGEYYTFVNSSKSSSSSLYEDAITLGRLRGRLQTLPGVDDDLIATANVSSGGAYLIISPSLGASEAAKVIDTALDTRDVSLVKARLKKSP